MLHRDEVIIRKVISEIDIGISLLGDTALEDFIK